MHTLSALFTASLVLLGSPPEAYNRNAVKAKFVRPSTVPQAPGNEPTPERLQLGKALFFDPRLSGSGLVSCASCHNPSFSWGDGLERGVGWQMKRLPRRTPTILNIAWAETLFWDGRAGSLEEQSLGPITSLDEMHASIEHLLPKLAALEGYWQAFEKAYPGEGITGKTLAKAIAVYERTVVSGQAPFDEWISGKEAAISESAKRGFDLFNTTANCAKCHSGWNFTDDGFHDLGIADDDHGRGNLVPGKADLQFTFKTPTLRNVVQRAPYMHDGSLATLEAVMNLYDKGPQIRRESISPDFLKLNLSAQAKRDLIDFLATLTSNDPLVELPVLPVGKR